MINIHPPQVLFGLFVVYGLSGYAVYVWSKLKGKPVSVIATRPTSPTNRACTAETCVLY